MGDVTPRLASNNRVSCTTRPPPSSTSACRSISYSRARCTLRHELTFLISVRVPSVSTPLGRNDTLASQRRLPSSILPPPPSMYSTIVLSLWRHGLPHDGARQ